MTKVLRKHPTIDDRRRQHQPLDRSRIAANNVRVTATSASWNVTYFECCVTSAPILTIFSRSVVSDHCFTLRSNASRRRKLARLCRSQTPVELFSLDGRPELARVQVETTDVSAYQSLLTEDR